LRRRFPQFQFDDSYVGALESEAGFLFVDDCVRALIDDAIAAGATIREMVPVVDWQATPEGVRVRTDSGEFYGAKLVLTAGPWTGELLKSWGARLTVMRQVVFWFDPSSRMQFELPQFPVFMADTPDGCFYGIPATDGHGLKLARHYGAPELSEPEQVERSISAGEEAPVRAFLDSHLPAAASRVQDASICLYTLTPDRHFVIDVHPEHGAVVVACGFSGHGFKFAPVVGELLADLTDGAMMRGPALFRITRFQ
jgi:sarcosine oxidase